MQELTMELAVGDVLRIGDRTLTVIDIDGAEVSFRLDDAADGADSDENLALPPRK